jgi:hypothetical protein
MRQYSFLNTIMLVGAPPIVPVPQQITGFWEGDDVIKMARNAVGASHVVGADGKMSVSVSADKSGSVEFKLSQLSSSNRLLLLILRAQEQAGPAFAPVQLTFTDLNRQDVGAGLAGYIEKLPDIERGAKAVAQTWKIVCERLDMDLGNPAFAGFALNG